MSLQKVTSENFDQFIGTGVTVVDFSASWCGPCRQLKPIISKVADNYDGRASIGVLDIDDNRDIAERYKVMAVPTMLFFKDGELVKVTQGVQLAEKISHVIDQYLCD